MAAIDEATADKAIRLIKMRVRELPAYFKAADAMAPTAVQLHEKKPGNLERDVLFELGNVAEAFAAADLVHEPTYNCAEVCQNQMEMHAAVADYDAVRDRITVHASTQVPYYVHMMLAQVLGMDMSRIRVVKPFVGGGFGCRTETLNVELITALMFVLVVWGTPAGPLLASRLILVCILIALFGIDLGRFVTLDVAYVADIVSGATATTYQIDATTGATKFDEKMIRW